MADEIDSIICEELVNTLGLENPGEEIFPDTIICSLNLDSISVLTLIYQLEERFNVAIEHLELSGFDTVADMAALIESLCHGKN